MVSPRAPSGTSMIDRPKVRGDYASGGYWLRRQHLMYYQCIRQVVDFLGTPGTSILDVGSGNSPYLEWFEWAEPRVSVDINVPYRSETVTGIQADILTHRFERVFDICTCFQVLEHVVEPKPFAQRLFELGHVVVVSVPLGWPRGWLKGHVQDPVDQAKLAAWTRRAPDYEIVVKEPLRHNCAERLVCIYDPERRNEPLQTFLAKGSK